MKQKEISLEEYKTLRQETLQLFRQAHHLILLGLTSAGLILGYIFGTNSEYWPIFILPIFILFGCVLAITERIHHAWVIGRYIQIFLEKDTALYWESAWEKFRERETKGIIRGTIGRFFSFAATSSIPLILVQLICIFLAEKKGMPLFFFVLLILLLLFQIILILYAERGKYLCMRFDKIKKELK